MGLPVFSRDGHGKTPKLPRNTIPTWFAVESVQESGLAGESALNSVNLTVVQVGL
jgi:hypothetical protein